MNLGIIDVDVMKYKDLVFESTVTYASRAFLAILILVIGFKIIKAFLKIIDKIFIAQRVAPAVRGFLDSLLSIILKG